MLIKQFAALLIVGTFAVNAQAWTVTTKGTISTGADTTGVFGVAGRDLAGLSFTQSVTASTDPAQWSYVLVADALEGIGPAFTVTVTVDGSSAVFSSPVTSNGYQQARIWDRASALISQQSGRTASGGSLYSFQFVNNWTAAFLTGGFDQELALYTGGPYFYIKDSQFSISGDQIANFEGRTDYLAVNAPLPPPVAEPETFAMLLVGLGLMRFLSRNLKALR